MIKKKLKKIEGQVSQAKDMSAELLNDLKKLVSSTRKDLQKQVEELRSQVKELTEGSAKPALKAINKFEQRYQDQLARLQVEFDRKTDALIAAKDAIISQIEEEVTTRFPGLAKSKASAEPAVKQSKTQQAAAKAKKAMAAAEKAAPKADVKKAPAKKAPAKKTAAKKAPAKKTAEKKVEAKKAPAKKAPAKKAPAKKATAKAASISAISGIGPVTVKKLEEAGIKTLKDIAAPSAAKKKALEQFSKVRGFNTWQAQAQELLK